MAEVVITRRQAIGLMVGAALLGAVGGLTAKESGDWSESDDDEPPSRKERPCFTASI